MLTERFWRIEKTEDILSIKRPFLKSTQYVAFFKHFFFLPTYLKKKIVSKV